jgi:hypothetical protein
MVGDLAHVSGHSPARTGGSTLPPGAAVRACAWTGPLFVLMFLVGAVPLSRFFAPPTSAHGGAGEIAAMYTDNLGAIRIGILLMCLASPLFATFAMAIATMTRPSDPSGGSSTTARSP